MKDDTPRLSVLLTAGNRRERVANALASVLNQNLVDQLEVILLECGDADAATPVPGMNHPRVRIHRFPQGASAGHVRAEAIRMARAPIIVFLEEHAAAYPSWAEVILNTFDGGDWAAVGPEIINGTALIGISDALSMAHYPRYESPATRQTVEWLPFHNTAYRRDILLKYNDLLETLFALEILLQWRLYADGYHLLLEPECRVIHYTETDIYAVWKHEVNASRVFVVNRANLYGWPVWLRMLRALATPLIPFSRSLKLFLIMLRYRPNQLGRYFRGLPALWASTLTACAAGEFLGLLRGAADGDVRYLYHSVNAFRRLPSDFPHFTFEEK